MSSRPEPCGRTCSNRYKNTLEEDAARVQSDGFSSTLQRVIRDVPVRVRHRNCRSPQQQQTLKFAPSISHSIRLRQAVTVAVPLSVNQLSVIVHEYVVAAPVLSDGSEERVAALVARGGVGYSRLSYL